MGPASAQNGTAPGAPNAPTGFMRVSSPINHVLVAGQSLAMGAYATNPLSTHQPYGNRMFKGQQLDGGVPGLLPDDLSGLVPLREQAQLSQHGGETLASGFANWIGAQVGTGVHDLLVSNCARGGSDYALLKRQPTRAPMDTPTGSFSHLRGLAQVSAARALTGDRGYRFRSILVVHGEGDNVNPVYDRNIRDWQADYEADIQAITGQTNVIPMYHTQISAWNSLGNANRSLSIQKVLDESILNPTRTLLVGPKYILPYQSDGLHLTAEGYRWLGEYYAKAYYRHEVLGNNWTSLRPVPESMTRSNNIIDLMFTGVVGQLVLDTNLVVDPAGQEIFHASGSPWGGPAMARIGPYGFEYWNSEGAGAPWRCATTITNVAITGTNTIRIMLSRTPSGAHSHLRYAYSTASFAEGGRGGPALGPRGCLRDTDPAESRHGNTLYNWSVHFDFVCP